MNQRAGFYPEPFRPSSCRFRCAAARDPFGRRIITISTSHRTRSSWRSCATFIAIPGVPSARTLCAGVEFGQARPRYQARGVALVKLSPLSNGHARYRRNRIGMDGQRERLATSCVDAQQAARFPFPGPQRRGTGGTLVVVWLERIVGTGATRQMLRPLPCPQMRGTWGTQISVHSAGWGPGPPAIIVTIWPPSSGFGHFFSKLR